MPTKKTKLTKLAKVYEKEVEWLKANPTATLHDVVDHAERVMAKMVDVLHAPKNEMPRIDMMWAFLSVDPEDGNEGVIAGPLMGAGSLVPLVAADEKRLASLEPFARQWATVFGRVVRLVKFSQREVIREFGGQ
jgi:altronate dehydratase